MATNALPREKLKELLEKNGDSLLQDRDRCEGLLKDYCAGHRREISAIVGALEERIPLELRSSWQSAMTPEAMSARLVQRLEENRGLAPEIASYAVEAWSYALGVNLGRSSERVADVLPLGTQNGVANVQAGSSLPDSGKVSHQNKAIAGGVGLLAAAAVAFAVLHHPTPPLSPNPNPPTPLPAPSPALTPVPKPSPDGKTADNQTPASTVKDGPHKAAFHLPVGTSVVVRLNSDFNSDQANLGDLLPATVVSPLTSRGNVVVERGASAQLKVVVIDKTGTVTGKAHLEFALVGLTAHGKLVHVTASSKSADGPSQGARTATKTGIGGAAGAAIGHIKGHLFHRAGTGAAAATGAEGASPPPVKISADIVMQFLLTKALSLGS